MKAPPLKLHNYFEELYVFNTLEDVATGSTHVLSLKEASSIKKHGTDKPSAYLIPHSQLFKTI